MITLILMSIPFEVIPWVDFTNVFARIFRTRFSYERLFSSYVLRNTHAKTVGEIDPLTIFDSYETFTWQGSVFQPFSSRGTSQKFLIIWRNLNAPYSTIYSIFREPNKELAEPRLKNTVIGSCILGFIKIVKLRTSSTST